MAENNSINVAGSTHRATRKSARDKNTHWYNNVKSYCGSDVALNSLFDNKFKISDNDSDLCRCAKEIYNVNANKGK